MSSFAAEGHRVLFVENTGVRGPMIGDLPRVRKRLISWWRATKGFREERPNLFLYSPLLVPFPYSRLARWINRSFMLRALRRWMRVTGFHRPIVWSFLPTPLALDLIHAVDSQLTIYYCIDDLASSSVGARRIVASEETALSRGRPGLRDLRETRGAGVTVHFTRPFVSFWRELRAVRAHPRGH